MHMTYWACVTAQQNCCKHSNFLKENVSVTSTITMYIKSKQANCCIKDIMALTVW